MGGFQASIAATGAPNANSLDRDHVIVLERLYHGPRRWRTQQDRGPWAFLSAKIDSKHQTPETHWRDADVRASAEYCLEPLPEAKDRGHYLWTCLHPTCPRPTQGRSSSPPQAALGSASVTCPNCQGTMRLLETRHVENKWIYILSGSSGALTLEYEVYAGNAEGNRPPKWYVRKKPDPSSSIDARPCFNADLTPAKGVGVLPVPGVSLPPKKDGSKVKYHFFLSPYQLGPKAIDELRNAPSRATSWHDKHARKNGQYFDDSVLDSTLVGRELGEPGDLYVAVPDPWLWAVEAATFDYHAVMAAKLAFLTNPKEQFKHLIASTLDQLVGAPDKEGKRPDKLDLADDMRPETQPSAWVKKYEDANKFLHEQADLACKDLIRTLDSHSHRVVEVSCQENADKPDFIAEAYIHYVLVLGEMLGSDAGQSFVKALFDELNKPGADQRLPASHILAKALPKNVLLDDVGEEVVAQLLAVFAPGFVGSEADPLAALNSRIKRMGLSIEAEKPEETDDRFKFGKLIDQGKAVKEFYGTVDEKYKTTDAALAKAEKAQVWLVGPRRARMFRERIKTKVPIEDTIKGFAALKQAKEYFDFIAGFAVFSKEFKPESWRGVKDDVKARTDQVQKSIEYFVKYRQWRITVEARGLRNVHPAIRGAAQAKAAELARRHHSHTQFLKKVNLPYTVVFGGVDMILDFREAGAATLHGDYGAATGKALMAMGGVVAVSAAIAELGSLVGITAFKAAAATSRLGVVGVIAAAFILAGGLVYWAFAKNSFEMFASRCFLGKKYGDSRGWIEVISDMHLDIPKWAKKDYNEWHELGYEFQWKVLIELISTPKLSLEVVGPEAPGDIMIPQHIRVKKLRAVLKVVNFPELFDAYLVEFEPEVWHYPGSGLAIRGRMIPNKDASGRPQEQKLTIALPSKETLICRAPNGTVDCLVYEWDWDQLRKDTNSDAGQAARKEPIFLSFKGTVRPRFTGGDAISTSEVDVSGDVGDPFEQKFYSEYPGPTIRAAR